MTARAKLRAATAADHERVDRLFCAFDLSQTDHYRRFLAAQAAAFLPLEAALDAAGAGAILSDWEARRRGDLLRADLHDLGTPEPPPLEPPALPDAPAILGAVYVLEGSRLGGALLKRALPTSAPRRFLDANQAPGSWRKFLEKLDKYLYRSQLLEAAAGTASEVFYRFEAGGLRYLETERA